ncbi:pyridoxal phosphate-dependent aminotransferase [Sinomonas mesophila]|uniref:pyridoxal phosphate-dependent aminotransferase n=1 Tax=Sinomonas mesophila TaxID=1531955 RepID=UPI000986855F|nr:pyridoxal phosphate-dependent aminotransferase [Sinomonas mesophila]
MRTRPERLRDVHGFTIDRVAAAAEADPDMLRLENLDTDLRPPAAAIVATRDTVGRDEANSYLPFTGQLGAARAVAGHIERRSGVAYDPEREIVLTTSEGDALLDALLALSDPGDEVILTDPTYAGMLNRVRLAGCVPRLVPMARASGAWRMDLDALAAAAGPRTRALFLQNPSFPTGYLLNAAEWEAVTRLCLERDLWLIYWSFMEGIVYDGAAVVCPQAFEDMRERTVVVGAPSAEQRMIGWRIGWIAAPAAVMPDLSVVHIYNGITPGGIAQAGLAAALTADDGLAGCVAEWQRRRDTVCSQLAEMPTVPAAGGWSQVLDTRELGFAPGEVSDALLGHGVAATAMTGWGGDVADRQLRIVFSNEPAERLALLGDRFSAALADLRRG